MLKSWRVFLVVLAVAFAVLPMAAHAEGDNISRITRWTVDRGSVDLFEAGLAAHSKLHADQNDDWVLNTFEVISGPNTGSYIRATFGHDWADFDSEGDKSVGDAEDSAIHTAPYIESATTSFYRSMPEISRSSGGPAPFARAIHFYVNSGGGRDFEGAIEKIHAALTKRDWPSYVWYELVDGGYSPTYVVVLPRANWAGFAPGETTLGAAVNEEYGDEAAGIFAALFGSVAKQWSETIAYRPDLSYVPASE